MTEDGATQIITLLKLRGIRLCRTDYVFTGGMGTREEIKALFDKDAVNEIVSAAAVARLAEVKR